MRLFFIIICVIFLIAAPLIVWAVKIESPFGEKSVEDIIGNIRKAMETIAIALGAVMLIISGLLYMTSGGSQERVATAKKTMLYTVIGVAVVFAVSLIMELVKALFK